MFGGSREFPGNPIAETTLLHVGKHAVTSTNWDLTCYRNVGKAPITGAASSDLKVVSPLDHLHVQSEENMVFHRFCLAVTGST